MATGNKLLENHGFMPSRGENRKTEYTKYLDYKSTYSLSINRNNKDTLGTNRNDLYCTRGIERKKTEIRKSAGYE